MTMCDCLGGVYRAVVITTHDPQHLGRVKLQIPHVLGSAASAWARPSVANPVIPNAGDQVWVLFEAKDPNNPVYLASGG